MLVKTLSHQRSGTWFLKHTLLENFDIEVARGPHYSPYNKDGYCVKNHIYIYRDGRDVLVSLYYHMKVGEPRNCIKNINDYCDISFKDFLRGQFKALPGKRSMIGFNEIFSNPAKYWAKHTEWVDKHGWCVRYEDLKNKPEETIIKISNMIGVELKNNTPTPVKKLVGINPRKGIVGDWKDHFDAEDLEYFYAQVGNRMEVLGYDTMAG